ncbi:unnamed protein product [Soboliphyme baturini]|uniref:Cytochrome b5 heme-binding domain-containing protein n=1 Tax=Soboliphyme baturini TaxID=241478 RepID=A0A183IVU2_9BILA|nr:unnamed protein product [Soboliphyme baturini]
MFYPKLVIAITIQVFLLSFALNYYGLDGFDKLTAVLCTAKGEDGFGRGERNTIDSRPSEKATRVRVFEEDELRQYDGSIGSPGLYLALLGQVFDVQKGEKHYGPRGSYSFFAGIDGTRAFITGDFSPEGLTDDINGLDSQDLIGLREWLDFYRKEYSPVGVLRGKYYDKDGAPTEDVMRFRKKVEDALAQQRVLTVETERFPPCNSEWIQGKGGRVWCSSRSGGVKRDWVGVPRKYFKPGSIRPRCVCVKNFGPPQGNDPVLPKDNSGDLRHPNLAEYTNCSPESVFCDMSL